AIRADGWGGGKESIEAKGVRLVAECMHLVSSAAKRAYDGYAAHGLCFRHEHRNLAPFRIAGPRTPHRHRGLLLTRPRSLSIPESMVMKQRAKKSSLRPKGSPM